MLVMVLMEEVIIAYFVKGKGHSIQMCVFPQTFDILIYCVAEDRAIAFLPMKKKKVTFIVN